MCVAPKGVYSKDDCGKLKSKDSNHTRRSKQNTYHVVSKNIDPSKVTDGQRRKRGCPGCPWILPWVLRESWIRGCPDGRTIPSAGLLDYEDTRLKTSSRVRKGLFIGMEGKLGDSDVDLLLCKLTLCNPSPLRCLYKPEGLVRRTTIIIS